MPKAHDDNTLWRVYDPALVGFYVTFKARSHWTRRHNAQQVADEINHWRNDGRPKAMVKKYQLVEVEDTP